MPNKTFKETSPGVYKDSAGSEYGLNHPDKSKRKPLPTGAKIEISPLSETRKYTHPDDPPRLRKRNSGKSDAE